MGEEAAPGYSQDAGPCGSLEGSAVHLLQMYVFFQFPAWKDSFTPTSIAVYVYTCSHLLCAPCWGGGGKGRGRQTERKTRSLGETVSLLLHVSGFAYCLSFALTWWNPLSCDLMDSAPLVGFVRTSCQAAGEDFKMLLLSKSKATGLKCGLCLIIL